MIVLTPALAHAMLYVSAGRCYTRFCAHPTVLEAGLRRLAWLEQQGRLRAPNAAYAVAQKIRRYV